MTVAKVTEITASSTKSIDDAVRSGVERASRTLDGIRGAWVKGVKVDVKDGKVTQYRVNLKITFVLKD